MIAAQSSIVQKEEELMIKEMKIHHVAIVVDDIDSALGFWRDGLGLELSHIENIPEQQSEIAFLPAGDSEIELVRPTSDDSGVARYLQKRGPGIHHICFQVDDIHAYLHRLKNMKIQLINEEPLTDENGKQFAFIHPKSTHGVLVELYQLPEN
jgi:methylmalonyl-CoA/ethylmalonyl-CoA epimerase